MTLKQRRSIVQQRVKQQSIVNYMNKNYSRLQTKTHPPVVDNRSASIRNYSIRNSIDGGVKTIHRKPSLIDNLKSNIGRNWKNIE